MYAVVMQLQLADEYMLDHLKEMCEAELEHYVSPTRAHHPLSRYAQIESTNVEDMLCIAERNNAFQLRYDIIGSRCEDFKCACCTMLWSVCEELHAATSLVMLEHKFTPRLEIFDGFVMITY
jgi:hypothetical protein